MYSFCQTCIFARTSVKSSNPCTFKHSSRNCRVPAPRWPPSRHTASSSDRTSAPQCPVLRAMVPCRQPHFVLLHRHHNLLHRIPLAFHSQTSSSDDRLPEIASFVAPLLGRPSAFVCRAAHKMLEVTIQVVLADVSPRRRLDSQIESGGQVSPSEPTADAVHVDPSIRRERARHHRP